MKALILIIILFSISCKKQDSSMNESNYQNPILANNYYDSDESFSSNKNELKILRNMNAEKRVFTPQFRPLFL